MIYLTHARLMAESENAVHVHAETGDGVSKSVCSQVVADAPRYSLWLARHDRSMTRVASARQRDRQITSLRAVAVEQVHRSALVRYFREYQVRGLAREQTLREFYGACDVQRAVLAEHRGYLVAASSHFCALDLLDLTGDRRGRDMLARYEALYGHYFSMFCDRARARRKGRQYLLEGLIPEIKGNADNLRARILSGMLLPSQRSSGLDRARRG